MSVEPRLRPYSISRRRSSPLRARTSVVPDATVALLMSASMGAGGAGGACACALVAAGVARRVRRAVTGRADAAAAVLARAAACGRARADIIASSSHRGRILAAKDAAMRGGAREVWIKK